MARATLFYKDKGLFPDGGIVEITIWRLPAASAERPHGLKYSLYYGRNGVRLVGYDNEQGKGDDRHYGDREEPYAFTSVEQLIADFLSDVRKLRSLPN
jgi:hypothetical protein